MSILWNGILYNSKIIFHIAHTHVFNFFSKSINIFEENVESFFLLYFSFSYLAIFKCFLLFFSLIKFRRGMKRSLKDYYVVFVKKIFIRTWELMFKLEYKCRYCERKNGESFLPLYFFSSSSRNLRLV